MTFCPNCGVRIDSQVTECPGCGNPLSNAPAQAKRKAPRIIREEPLPQQPAHTFSFQQPPYGHSPVPALSQQQYTQPVPQQLPYGQPDYFQPLPKKGGSSMALALLGGILVMVGSMFLWYTDMGWFTTFLGVQDMGKNEMVYAWFIPFLGLLAVTFSVLAFASQKKIFAASTTVSGLGAAVVAVILPLHMSMDGGGLTEFLYVSDGIFMLVYVGGFIAIAGGILAIIGGFMLSRKLTPVRMAVRQQY